MILNLCTFGTPCIICGSNSENFVFTLLNMRSLKRVVLDSKIVKSDITALTETRLKPSQNIDSIEETLNNFQIVHQELNNSHLSLAVCTNIYQCVIVSEKQFFAEVNGILMTTRKRDRRLKVLLLYRPKDMHPLQFCNSLENILNTCKIELILGDFNINFHKEIHPSVTHPVTFLCFPGQRFHSPAPTAIPNSTRRTFLFPGN